MNFSLAPLVKKIHEQQVLAMTNKLCDKLLNVKDQRRDIASIAMKTIVAEVPSVSVAQSILVSITPKLISGITSTVSCNIFAKACMLGDSKICPFHDINEPAFPYGI